MSIKKKELGQFFTSPRIAEFMVNLAIDSDTETLLDPAVGSGIFVEYAHRKNKNTAITAHEIDPDMISVYRNNVNFSTELIAGDYIKCEEKQFDSIICNPPYNRFQEIPNRGDYIELFKNRFNIELSAFSNLFVYFLVKSLHELKKNGKCVYLVPYEFLNTGYGIAIKRFFAEQKTLKTIYKFNNSISLFGDAITTSCILVFENCLHSSVEFISINSIEEIETMCFHCLTKIDYDQIDCNLKWNCYFSPSNPTYDGLIPFKKIARVKRGIATGNNSFFSLSKSQMIDLNLSPASCIKCISKSSDIKTTVFTNESFEKLSIADKKVYLFDGERAESENDYSYIRRGEHNGVNTSYLNSHRNPWYQIEAREVAPIWISVFSRKRIKIVRNETIVKNLTTFHGIYVKNDYIDFIDVFFCYLLTPIAQKILYNNKREYGDGLDKFEPNDLNDAFVLDVKKISINDLARIRTLYANIKTASSAGDIIAVLDGIFKKYIISR